MKKKLKKWYEIYPQGTKEGDEEQVFFSILARNKKWRWRSTAALSRESGLSKERIDELLAKYFKMGMVFQNPANAEEWAYWERVPEMLDADDGTITEKDHKQRIDSQLDYKD